MAIASVIVLNFNGKDFLEECLNSLKAVSGPAFEIWFIDNGSTDGSVEFVRQRFPSVRILGLGKNTGFSEAYNRTMENITTPYAVFLNNDTVVTPEWLDRLIGAAERENADIVGSKILSYARRKTILSAGLMITPAGVAYEMGLGFDDVSGSEYNKPKGVGGVSGASMLVRTEVFRELGGFDEAYFAYLEDLDLCWRASLLGKKVFYEPASVVYHHSGGTTGGIDSPLRVYYMQKNMIRTALKLFGPWHLMRAIAISTIYTCFRLVLYFVTFQPSLAWALVCGSFEPVTDLSRLWKQRSIIQHSRIVTEKEFSQRGWICSMWDALGEYVRSRGVLYACRDALPDVACQNRKS